MKYPPNLNELEALLFNHFYKSKLVLESAVNYTKNVSNNLLSYLLSGYIEISNNIAKRTIKHFVINRIVFITTTSFNRERYTTLLFSYIRNAHMIKLNVSK